MIDASTLSGLGIPVATGTDIYAYVANILNVVLVIAAVLALIYLIYAGLQYITSAGDENKAGAAKKNITNVVIGIAVIMLAFVIINTVTAALQGTLRPSAGGGGGGTGGGGGPVTTNPNLPPTVVINPAPGNPQTPPNNTPPGGTQVTPDMYSRSARFGNTVDPTNNQDATTDSQFGDYSGNYDSEAAQR